MIDSEGGVGPLLVVGGGAVHMTSEMEVTMYSFERSSTFAIAFLVCGLMAEPGASEQLEFGTFNEVTPAWAVSEPALALSPSGEEKALEHETLIWSVKFLCSRIPFRFPVVNAGLWFTDINIHNLNHYPVTLYWKVTREDGILSTGTTEIEPNGVLDIECRDEPFGFDLKGFLELKAYLPLQVVAVYKNLELIESQTQKGFIIPLTQVRTDTMTYVSEYVCGDAESHLPASFADLAEYLDPDDKEKVWRPGFVFTNVRVYNPTRQESWVGFRVVDSAGETLASEQIQFAGETAKTFDCDSFSYEGPRSDGFFVFESKGIPLNVVFDKTDYIVDIAVAMDIEYVKPLKVVTRFETPSH